jgi:hypothetical protein
MRKAAAERDAERRGDARSLTGRFNNLLRALAVVTGKDPHPVFLHQAPHLES